MLDTDHNTMNTNQYQYYGINGNRVNVYMYKEGCPFDFKIYRGSLCLYLGLHKNRPGPLSKGLVIIYDQGGGAGSTDFLWKIFSWPTRRAKKEIRGLLDRA